MKPFLWNLILFVGYRLNFLHTTKLSDTLFEALFNSESLQERTMQKINIKLFIREL